MEVISTFLLLKGDINYMEKTVAIVLAAGQGKRMQSDVKKQYISLCGKPILYYTIKTFQESFIDEIILVAGEDDVDYLQNEYVNKFHFNKVRAIVIGGKERYHSVAAGLNAIEKCDYVFIHDGARPFVDEEILNRTYDAVKECKACVAAMPVKDTIKIADENGFATSTPRRDLVWQVQTPQVFEFSLIKACYMELIKKEKDILASGIKITDDAMVVETFSDCKVKLVEGSYENIKITTQDDLVSGEKIIESRFVKKV